MLVLGWWVSLPFLFLIHLPLHIFQIQDNNNLPYILKYHIAEIPNHALIENNFYIENLNGLLSLFDNIRMITQ